MEGMGEPCCDPWCRGTTSNLHPDPPPHGAGRRPRVPVTSHAMSNPRVVVVGAGPAGAALSYLLARRGISVTLVERHTDFAREFRGEGLMPSGAAALAEMGLA